MFSHFIELEKLNKKYGPRQFGQICQIFLALTLIKIGFKIPVFNTVGRPDMEAILENERYSIEVKTGDKEIGLTDKDVDSIRKPRYEPVLAVFTYPDLECSWIMASAMTLSSGTFYKSELKELSIRSLDKRVNKAFRDVVDKHFDVAYNSINKLRKTLEELRKRSL